jgi:cytochrome c oxidase subunit 2
MRIVRAGLEAAAKLVAGAACLVTTAAVAGTGQPSPWQIDMQGQVTELGRGVASFHWWITLLMALITLFVLGLIIAVVVRFGEKRNPVPSKTTHNALLEVAWTLVPVLILVAIAVPSFRLLRFQLSEPKADMVLKVIGHAWYWEYQYPQDQGGFKFDSNLLEGADLEKSGQPKLLAVDNEAVVPVGKTIAVQVTAADVLHSFAVPSFGFKIDAVPGRLNQMWFKADREGVYYGQCSELCGSRHAFMPIAVRVVSEAQYASWIEEAKKKYARLDGDAKFADAR